METPFRVPRFYPILDTAVLAARGFAVIPAARCLIESGAKILQYRHKDEWRQSNFDEAKQLAALCQDAGVLFVLNDRADFASLLKSALHVGQGDLSPCTARTLIRDEVMGFSTHIAEQLERADQEPVEYLSLGPIFATTSKLRPDPVVGLDGLRALRPLTKKPLVAIGGITLSNAASVLSGGADSVAVISGFLPESPGEAAMKRLAALWLKLT